MAQRAEAKALIYNSSKEALISSSQCPIPFLHRYDPRQHQEALRYQFSSLINDTNLPSLTELPANPDSAAYILHTTGSTSGKPKLVPWTYRWIDHNIEKMAAGGLLFSQLDEEFEQKQFVTTWIGTMCHAGQLANFLRVFNTTSCVIQPSSLTFSTDELKDMIRRCSLTTLCQFPSLFSAHLAQARNDSELLALLQGLDCAFLAGMTSSQSDVNWCVEKGIKLQFVFASTECGYLLRTATEKPYNLYKAIEGSSFVFSPVLDDSTESIEVQQPVRKLLELIVPSNSKDRPVPALCSSVDGCFRTGDLFEEIEPGFFEFRGRADDWIKLRSACRCNTRAIEENFLRTCQDLIQTCVATGFSRPCLVIFAEVPGDLVGSEAQYPDELALKEEILRRIHPAQVKMWTHEMILDHRQIRIVPSGSLPRTSTKRNIRRRGVEEMFERELDAVYAEMGAGKKGL
jgi:acyl-coenzyme A synthetase/AMP-(fatty) acid ligase